MIKCSITYPPTTYNSLRREATPARERLDVIEAKDGIGLEYLGQLNGFLYLPIGIHELVLGLYVSHSL